MKAFLLLIFDFVFPFTVIFAIISADVAENVDKVFLPDSDDSISPMNTVDGAFPSNPTYVVYQKYQDNQCLDFQGIESALLDTCLFSRSGSRKYTCVNGEAIYNRYSDASCSILTDVHEVNSNCNGKLNAILLSCSTSDPFAFQEGDYFTQTFYQDNTCSNVLGAVGILNGLCRPTEYTRSIRYDWPYWTYYINSTTCEGSYLLPTNVSTLGCFYMGASDDDALRYDSFSRYSYIWNAAGDSDDGSSSANSLSIGPIVGIAVSGAVAAVLASAALYWHLTKTKTTSMDTHQHQQVGIEQVATA